MNLDKGFKRLTIVLSVLVGPIFIIYLLATEGSPSDVLDLILGLLVFCGGGFLTVWAIYGIALFVVRGFCDVKGEWRRRHDTMNLKRGFRRIILFLAVVASILGAVSVFFIVVIDSRAAKDCLQEKRFAYLNAYGLETFTRDGIKFLPDKPTRTEIDAYKAELKRRAAELNKKIQGVPVRLSVVEEIGAIKELEKLENGFWVTLSLWGLVGLCVLVALGGATVGFFGVWSTFWFGGLAVYKLITWFVLGFSDTDNEKKAK